MNISNPVINLSDPFVRAEIGSVYVKALRLGLLPADTLLSNLIALVDHINHALACADMARYVDKVTGMLAAAKDAEELVRWGDTNDKA